MFRRHKDTLILPALATLALIGALEFYGKFPIARIPSSVNLSQDTAQDEIGNNLPDKGRSYFDIVFSKLDKNQYSYDIPFPLEKFAEKLENYTGQKLNSTESAGLVAAIFPMGRSLQRNAAVHGQSHLQNADLYFQYPRVVFAVDSESKNSSSLQINLKNKFYAGYNEKAQILEIISYNEDLGRFEYQIVNDYAAGKTPKVRYAQRALCLSCHQNQAPIFSKAPWSESNANPAVATELKRVLNSDFYKSIPLAGDESLTGRFDTSSDQANLLPAYQKIWKTLCKNDECQKNIILSVLQLRLNRGHLLTSKPALASWLESFERAWNTQWPTGFPILSSDIPNRDPFRDVTAQSGSVVLDSGITKKFSSVSELLTQSKIPATYEPLVPRNPSEIWNGSALDFTHGNRLVRGLSQEFTLTDIRLIDNWLVANTEASPIATLHSSCKIEKTAASLSVDCPASAENKFHFSVLQKQGERIATISRLTLLPIDQTGEENLIATGITAHIQEGVSNISISLRTADGISLRSANGYFVSEIKIAKSNGIGSLHLHDQNTALSQLAEKLQQQLDKSSAFSRFNIMKSFLQFAGHDLAIEDTQRISLPVQVSSESDNPLDSIAGGLNVIKNNCRECHRNSEAAPANFLGDTQAHFTDMDLCKRIEVCAARMIYRLKMRLCNPDDVKNKKIPMPPDFYLSSHKISRDKWMTDYNPKILSFLNTLVEESELARDIQSTGMTQSEAVNLSKDVLSDKCPDSSSIMYERLPKCEFDELKAATRCR